MKIFMSLLFMLLFCFSGLAQDIPSGSEQEVPAGEVSKENLGEAAAGGESGSETKSIKGGEAKPKVLEEMKVVSGDIDVTWYVPEFKIIEKKYKNQKRKKKTYRIFEATFIGRTDPKAKVSIGKYVHRVRNKKLKKLSSRRLMKTKSRKIKVDEDGVFRINMTLTTGLIQIPVRVKVGKKIKRMHLRAVVTKTKIKVANASELIIPCETCIWIGVGAGILSYQQDPPTDLRPIEYGSVTVPNFSIRGSAAVAKKWNVRWDLHTLKGTDLTTNDSQVTILNKSIAWTYFGLEAEHKLFSKKSLFGFSFLPSLLYGVQSQDMPFIQETVSPNFTIGSFKFNSASIGGVLLFNPHNKWQYEAFVRLQVALAGQGEVSLKSGFAFDGSVGAIYNMSKKWKLGIFWNGQYHNYTYSIADSDGTYSLLSSNVDFSIGYKF